MKIAVRRSKQKRVPGMIFNVFAWYRGGLPTKALAWKVPRIGRGSPAAEKYQG